MKTINSPDICQLSEEGLTKRFRSAYKDPAIPVITPEITKARSCILNGVIPTDLTRSKLYLDALRAKPNGDWIILEVKYSDNPSQKKQIRKKFIPFIVLMLNRLDRMKIDNPSSPP